MDTAPPRPPRDDDDPPDVDVDDVVVHEEGGSLDAVDEIVRLARIPGQHPSTSSVLTTAADRLREVLTREGGVDGHEVLDVMVSSLDVSPSPRNSLPALPCPTPTAHQYIRKRTER